MINEIPKSYKELNYKLYVAIMNKIPSEKPEDVDLEDWKRFLNVTILSILLGKSEGEIEALPAYKIVELCMAISFLDVPLKPEKNSYKVKQIEELTFDEFSTYQKLRTDQWNNLEDILLLLLKGANKEQIDQMSIYDVMQVFFCLNKSTRKYLIRLKYLIMWKLTKQIAKRLLMFWRTTKKEQRTSL